MGKTRFIAVFSLILISMYLLLFHFILFSPQAKDFTSLYAAILNLVASKNPYTQLFSSFLPVTKKLSSNLNPPIVLFMFSPLAKLSYFNALTVWTIFSFTIGLIGAGLAFYYAFTSHFLKKYYLVLYLFYLALFSTMMNLFLVQFGTVLLFFIMLGYHFYLTERPFAAGLNWGLIISFKFFPALLFFFVLRQGKLKVFFTMLTTTILACLLPYLLYGQAIYLQYTAMMSRVFWYGDNWNASIFGYIYRLFFNISTFNQLNISYFILFFIALITYFKKLGSEQPGQINHQPFCLTLTMMLLMAPFGWVYYFPLLIFPLVLTWVNATRCNKSMLMWLIALFFINAPQEYIISTHKLGFLTKLFFISSSFYGLLILNYLCIKEKIIYGKNEPNLSGDNRTFLRITILILTLGMTVTAFNFFSRL